MYTFAIGLNHPCACAGAPGTVASCCGGGGGGCTIGLTCDGSKPLWCGLPVMTSRCGRGRALLRLLGDTEGGMVADGGGAPAATPGAGPTPVPGAGVAMPETAGVPVAVAALDAGADLGAASLPFRVPRGRLNDPSACARCTSWSRRT